ncbi:CBS domain-containing protein [Tissierella pigra]|uniref:CBS domain-containing protein n=1 Tax=Tissierella pigra TaxID=2607614 RepID=A0A6N7XPK1_9FIRM|nr:CBS domain-containing protein [Tissierella pigra]MBU5425182.1 CBS domain-containing protein [Tissierella pigra]MSU02752.1 CBS domain-containing protein [Tissierella pigra]
MNIAFFLTPKSEIVYETINATMRQALEKMEHHRYTAIPLIDKKGKYVGVITEGDLLWKIKNTDDLTVDGTSKIPIKDVQRRTESHTVSISANMEDLILLAKNQNFVPVVDDQGIFIGIIKRSDIINYCADLLLKQKEDNLD